MNILLSHTNDVSDDEVDINFLSDHKVNDEDPFIEHFMGHIDEENEDVVNVNKNSHNFDHVNIGQNSRYVYGAGRSHQKIDMQPTDQNWIDSNWIFD